MGTGDEGRDRDGDQGRYGTDSVRMKNKGQRAYVTQLRNVALHEEKGNSLVWLDYCSQTIESAGLLNCRFLVSSPKGSE